ncbi:MAG: LysM peptidoglycan-binding domain-containing protein [Gammaproteobacteria bacterium]|nr:LysM peptidoglycan-binding domain-containing protein [Gammaproteobacteria bacterium]
MNKPLSIFLLLTLMFSQALAQIDEANDQEMRPVIEAYVVKKGDTLASLARRHLGPDAPWNINVAINPELADPDLIVPGQQINIITGYEPPEPEIVVEEVEAYQALIERVSNVVEKNIARTDWSNAAEGDELFPLDAVRTLANSAAVLQFDGTSSVLINEYSQVFLRALEAQESGISRNEIEILRGETELRLEKTDAPQQQIEINVAGTITRPERGSQGSNATRARMVGEDSTQVMVYEGSSAVESAGVSVAVETGMGTTAVAGQAPAEPERLLAAPDIQALNEDLYPTDVRFAWSAVDGAAAYRLDVCKDRRCAQPVFRQINISSNELSVPSLPVGTGFWRVTAVSQSGLDGFTSLPDQIEIVDAPPAPTKNRWIPLLVALFGVLLLALIVVVVLKSGRAEPTSEYGTTQVKDETTKRQSEGESTTRLEDEITEQLSEDEITTRLEDEITEQLSEGERTTRLDDAGTKRLNDGD